MKSKLTTILTLALMVMGLGSYAQMETDSVEVPDFQLKIGAHAGTTSGVGASLTAQYKDIALTLTGLPFGSKDRFTLLYGAELDFRLRDNKVIDIYLSNSFSSWRTAQKTNSWDVNTGFFEETIVTKTLNAGSALKFDISRDDSPLHFQFYIGYAMYNIEKDYIFYPSTGVGLYYNFAKQ